MKQKNIVLPENLRRFSHGLDSLNPFLLYHGIRTKDDTGYIGDIHLDPQLFIIISGEVDFYLDDVLLRGGRGDVFISNFWEPHAFRKTTEKLEFLSVTFSLFAIGEASPFSDFDWLLFLKQAPARRKTAFSAEERESILALTRKILFLDAVRPEGYRSMIWFAIHEMMFHINSKYISSAGGRGKVREEFKISPALELIHLNPNREISLNEAASACSMSRSAFCLAFKSIMGETFSHFAMKKRVGCACMLLKSPKYTIKEISDMCGFVNVTHFYHTFKKFRKCTPAEFAAERCFRQTDDENQ